MSETVVKQSVSLFSILYRNVNVCTKMEANADNMFR